MDPDKLGPLVVKRLLEHEGLITEAKRFLGALSDSTIERWKKDNSYPRGTRLNKLWYFLATAGLESPELHDLEQDHPYGAYLGRLLAFDVINLKDASESCGLKNEQDLLRVIRGQQEPSNPMFSLEELCVMHGNDLEEKEATLRGKLGDKIIKSVPAPVRETPSLKVETSHPRSSTTARAPGHVDETSIEKFILALACDIATLHAKVMYALDRLSPGQIAQLRKYVDSHALFNLSNALNGMGSTRALNDARDRR